MTLAFLYGLVVSMDPILRYFILFLLVAFEGPLVTMAAGLLGSVGTLNIFFAYLIVVVADLVSDIVYYEIGYWGGKKVETKIGSMTAERLLKLGKLFKTHPRKTVLVGKMSHFIGVPILVGAGASKVPFRTFVIYDGIATLPKSLVFIMVGYYFKTTSEFFNSYLRYGTFLMSGLVLVFFVLYILLGIYFDRKII